MGLAIVQQIARAHGGTLTVSSSPDAGTTFTLSLPRGGPHVMSAGRILVVDDDPQIRRVMRVTLTGQGYEVDDAKSGEAALEKLRDERFDLVLLDMNMPGMGGLETCRAIRAQSEIAIIMLTVRDSESDKVAALDAGADDYVTKPYNAPELLARIRAALAADAVDAGAERARLTIGAVEVDFDTRQVTARGRNVRLTPKEFELLRYLVDAREQSAVASRAVAGGLGTRLRRSGRLPAGVRESAAEEDRGEARPAACIS